MSEVRSNAAATATARRKFLSKMMFVCIIKSARLQEFWGLSVLVDLLIHSIQRNRQAVVTRRFQYTACVLRGACQFNPRKNHSRTGRPTQTPSAGESP